MASPSTGRHAAPIVAVSVGGALREGHDYLPAGPGASAGHDGHLAMEAEQIVVAGHGLTANPRRANHGSPGDPAHSLPPVGDMLRRGRHRVPTGAVKPSAAPSRAGSRG